jgi:hypothetical protein
VAWLDRPKRRHSKSTICNGDDSRFHRLCECVTRGSMPIGAWLTRAVAPDCPISDLRGEPLDPSGQPGEDQMRPIFVRHSQRQCVTSCPLAARVSVEGLAAVCRWRQPRAGRYARAGPSCVRPSQRALSKPRWQEQRTANGGGKDNNRREVRRAKTDAVGDQK